VQFTNSILFLGPVSGLASIKAALYNATEDEKKEAEST
jgi:hypothetical protein